MFSHLASSEEPSQDEFTEAQAERFQEAVAALKKHISQPFLQHISNSAAIVRHPHLQMDMVRLGIGCMVSRLTMIICCNCNLWLR